MVPRMARELLKGCGLARMPLWNDTVSTDGLPMDSSKVAILEVLRLVRSEVHPRV